VSDDSQDPYQSASAGAGWMPDTSGPDGVRVTIRIEPAVDRWRRWRNLMTVPDALVPAAVTRFDYQTLPGLVQRYLFRDRWVVDVEADTGERCRVAAADQRGAIANAQRIHAGIQREGLGFLHHLTAK
jgi:hypothetical protein